MRYIANFGKDGFTSFNFDGVFFSINFGAWRTEDEIKQVVAALRQVLGRSDDAVNAARVGV